MPYNPPQGNNLNFDLEKYSIPDVIVFNLEEEIIETKKIEPYISLLTGKPMLILTKDNKYLDIIGGKNLNSFEKRFIKKL